MDPFTGQWRCTLDPWTLPFPKPQSWTVRIRVDGGFIAIVENIVQTDGAPMTIALRAAFDSQHYPVIGSPTVDTIAYKRVNETAIEGVGHKNGVLSLTDTLTVGDTLNINGTLHLASALPITAIFERVPPDSRDDLVDRFLLHAALDWRTGGPDRDRKTHTAARLLARHPEIAHANIYTAVVSGDRDEVERILAGRPSAANEPGGPHAWPPLLYLLNSRFGTGNALAIARMLLDHGADPNGYYPGGNPTIHYTALTAVFGRGEEQAAMHPHARELATLLLDRGAEPYDEQVLYNVFADHASRRHLGDEAVWILELIEQHCAARGRQPDWDQWLLAYRASSARKLTPEDPFTAACMRLDRSAARELIDVNPELRRSYQPMRVAAETNRPDVIAFLVDELGFSPDLEDSARGRARPLHDAAYSDSPDAARALIDRGAAIDFHDDIHDATALWWAYWGLKPRMIEMLAPLSRDIWALAITGHAARVREVLEAEPRRAQATYHNMSPLFFLPDDEPAALEIIDALLAHGADPTLRSEDGDTAAERALARGMESAAARLSAS